MGVRVSPAVRISFGLLMLTVSILFVGDWIGLIPDASRIELEQRKKFSESLAVQFSSLAQSGEIKHVRTTLESIVRRNEDIESAAFRSLVGSGTVEVGNHSSNWTLAQDSKVSTVDQVIVPIYKGSQRWGSVEIRFAPAGNSWLLGAFDNSFIVLTLFVAVSGFFLYFVFLRRVMRELDPSKVVPARVKAAFDSLAEGVLILDEHGQVVLANDAFVDNASLDEAGIVGVRASDLNWSAYKTNVRPGKDKFPWARVLQSGKTLTGEKLTIHRESNIERSYTVNCTPIQDENNTVRGVITTFDDLTELEKRNEKLNRTLTELKQTQTDVDLKNKELQYLATRDPLTNCLNRRAFNEQFSPLFDNAIAAGTSMVCMMIDIDHFKRVNDNYGHAVGDKVIKFVAGVLDKTVRQHDLLGRYGGEEFCIILDNCALDQAQAVAERMRKEIKSGDPCLFTSALNITASFGLAEVCTDVTDRDELVGNADKALYLAKESGRNKVMVWDRELESPHAADRAEAEAPDESSVEREIPGDILDAAMQDQDAQERIRQLEQIAEEKAQKLDRYVSYDQLTQLPVRHLFMDRIDQALQRARRDGRVLAVLSLGLESLNRVNDTLGHDTALAVLKETAERLQSVLRCSDSVSLLDSDSAETTISRLSEGEFGLLLPAVKDNESITWIVRRIFDVLQEPLCIGEDNIAINSNIGIGVYPTDGGDAQTLIKNASISRYYAEQQPGENNVEYFSEQINHLSREQLHMERQLSTAIDNQEFEMLYQPKVDLQSGDIIGFESLIRWNHPRWGTITPNKFIDIAERTRLINIIGDWVLRESCRQLVEFEQACSRELVLAVNMSPVQFSQPDLVERIVAIVQETGIRPERLELELTETCLMEDMGATQEILIQLQSHGIRISIDDFGTGYSGLSYLRTLPVNILKVDRCFVADIGVSEHDTAIVAAIISMAQALDLTVIAEGVESRRQMEALKELACDEAQGYYFSKPASADVAHAMLVSPERLACAG